MDSAIYISAHANKHQRCKYILSNTLPPPQASNRALKKMQRHPAQRPTLPPALQPPSPLFIHLLPLLLAQPDTIKEENNNKDSEDDNKEDDKDNKEKDK